MLAIVGIGAMVAFVFLGPLMQYIGGRSGGPRENPIAVETNYGDLTQGELEQLRYSRELVDRFFQQVTIRAMARQVEHGNLDARLFDTAVNRQHLAIRRELMARSKQGPEEAAVETFILANQAQQLGIVITDQAVNDLLKRISFDSLTPTELQEVIRGLQPGRPVSEARLFDALRTEMLAAEYVQLFSHSVSEISPAQRFAYYSQLNRQANAEVMPLAVADFIDQVADPSADEVQKYYDKYKNDFPDPNSPEPGFKEPKRASFQYFKFDLEAVTEKLKPEITDEEIAAYYEENKEQQFRAMDLGDVGPEGDATPAETDQPAEPDAEADKVPSDDAPAESPPAEPGEESAPDKDEAAEKPAEPAADETPSPEKAPADEGEAGKSDDSPADDSSADSPAESPAPEPDQSEPAPADDSAPQAARAASLPIRLVSATLSEEDPPADAAEKKPADDKPAEPATEPAAAEENSAETEPPADENPSEDKPVEETPDEEKPAEDKPADEMPAEDKPADETPAEGQPAAEAPAEKPEFDPLEEVADTIRTNLARQKAQKLVAEQIDKLNAEMRGHADERDIYEAEHGTNPAVKAPPPLDFAKLAEGTDAQPLELKSVTAAEAAAEDIGKSFRIVTNQRLQSVYTVPFAEFAYTDQLPTYKAETDQDNENHVFLFWKTQEEPAYVPPLDQIRDKVVRAWKMTGARDLARSRAEEFVSQARALDKPLKEAFSSQSALKVNETGPFSWLTFGNVPAQPGTPPHMSDVEGVDRPGKAFMEATFSLEDGGLAVAMNEPQDMVYVVRVSQFEPPMEELRDDFARANPAQYLTAAAEEQRAMFSAWINELNQEAGVTWLRQADARGSATEESEL